MRDAESKEATYRLLTGLLWMQKSLGTLSLLLQNEVARYALGIPVTEGLTQSAFLEMETLIQNMSDQATTLRRTLKDLQMTGYQQMTFDDLND